LVVGRHGVNFLMEVKTGDAQLNEPEKKFAVGWRGSYSVVRTLGEALKKVGIQ
jgi:hypothetical protein